MCTLIFPDLQAHRMRVGELFSPGLVCILFRKVLSLLFSSACKLLATLHSVMYAYKTDIHLVVLRLFELQCVP